MQIRKVVIKDLVNLCNEDGTHVEKITTIAGKPVFADSTATLDSDLHKMVDGLVEAGVDAELLEAEAHKGSTAHRFVELAKDADGDLIMLGSHGKGSLAGVFLGSFAPLLSANALASGSTRSVVGDRSVAHMIFLNTIPPFRGLRPASC